MKFKKIPLEKIKPPCRGVREPKVDTGIEKLAASIKDIGLIQPIIVCPLDDGSFELIVGQRRLVAYDYLNEKFPDDEYEEIHAYIILKSE